MKKFLLRSVIFFLPFLAITVLVEMLLRNVPNDYQIKSNALKRQAGNIEVLCLGSSHMFYGVDPTLLDRPSINAGYVSQTLEVDQEIFEKFKPDFKKLKFLVISVSYFSFSPKMENGPEPWRAKNYILYFGINVSNEPEYRFEVLTHPPRMNISRLYNYFLRHKPEVTSTVAGKIDSAQLHAEIDMEESGVLAAARHTTHSQADSAELRKSLEEMIRECDRMGVKVVLFFPPGYRSYTERLNPAQLASVRQVARELTGQFTNARYIDYLNDTSFTKADFYDADHLNQPGSAKLTRKLNAVMNQLNSRSEK